MWGKRMGIVVRHQERLWTCMWSECLCHWHEKKNRWDRLDTTQQIGKPRHSAVYEIKISGNNLKRDDFVASEHPMTHVYKITTCTHPHRLHCPCLAHFPQLHSLHRLRSQNPPPCPGLHLPHHHLHPEPRLQPGVHLLHVLPQFPYLGCQAQLLRRCFQALSVV